MAKLCLSCGDQVSGWQVILPIASGAGLGIIYPVIRSESHTSQLLSYLVGLFTTLGWQIEERGNPRCRAEGHREMGLPRFQIEGHIYHITTVVYDRLIIFTHPTFFIPLLDSLNFYRYKQEFRLLGQVVMPDQIHLIIWPFGSSTVSDIVRDYKGFTAKCILRQAEIEGVGDWVEAFRQAGKETGRSNNEVWQDGHWDENVYTESFLPQKLNHVHRNPPRAGLAVRTLQPPFSPGGAHASHRATRSGAYSDTERPLKMPLSSTVK